MRFIEILLKFPYEIFKRANIRVYAYRYRH